MMPPLVVRENPSVAATPPRVRFTIVVTFMVLVFAEPQLRQICPRDYR